MFQYLGIYQYDPLHTYIHTYIIHAYQVKRDKEIVSMNANGEVEPLYSCE